MTIIDCILASFADANGGGLRYPANPATGLPYAPADCLDWSERGTRLVMVLDLTDEQAQAVILANPDHEPRIVARAEVDSFMWADTRARRNAAIADVAWLVERHRQERELVAANKQSITTLTDAQYLALLQYIQALRDIPNAAEYPRQVTWPVRPEGL